MFLPHGVFFRSSDEYCLLIYEHLLLWYKWDFCFDFFSWTSSGFDCHCYIDFVKTVQKCFFSVLWKTLNSIKITSPEGLKELACVKTQSDVFLRDVHLISSHFLLCLFMLGYRGFSSTLGSLLVICVFLEKSTIWFAKQICEWLEDPLLSIFSISSGFEMIFPF